MNKLSIALLSSIVLVGSMLNPNPAKSDSSKAVIINIHNKVQSKSVNNPVWKMASLEGGLNEGDSIRTGSASRAEIRYNDGTITRLSSNSVMRINNNGDSKRTGLRLLIGKLWLKVTKGRGLLQITTPTATASVLGTELLVTNDEKDISHVTTLDGLVEVTGSLGDKTLVHPGEWVEIAPGKRMEAPTPFDWNELKKNERFVLDTDFKPSVDDFKDDNNWK